MLQDKKAHNYTFFTVADAKYIGMSLVMFESVRKVYPDAKLYLFVVGRGVAKSFDYLNLQIVYVSDFLDTTDLNQRILYYLNVEIATSVRPNCFKYLFDIGSEKVVYLDPDVYLFTELFEVERNFSQGINGILTPHSLHSLSSQDVVAGDEVFLQCGVYNMGFLALRKSSETERFLDWWSSKLKWDCLIDSNRGLFVDQKWMDLVPVYFEGFVALGNPGYNLAPWNSEHYKIIKGDNNLFFLEGLSDPITFIHFSGIKRSEHHFVGMEEPRRFYLAQIKKAERKLPTFSNFEMPKSRSGIPLDRVCTFLYREYVQKTKNQSSDPSFDQNFEKYIVSCDRRSGWPVYLRMMLLTMPEKWLPTMMRLEAVNFQNLTQFVQKSSISERILNIATFNKIANLTALAELATSIDNKMQEAHKINLVTRLKLSARRVPIFVVVYAKILKLLNLTSSIEFKGLNTLDSTMTILMEKFQRPPFIE